MASISISRLRLCLRSPLNFNERLFSSTSSSATTDLYPKASSNQWKTSNPSSLNQHELAKFAAIADTWKDPYCPKPFEGLKIVDVGCGGGILSEPLARMGATVTGVDAVENNIRIARLHADLDPVTAPIEYCCTTAEKLVEELREFDAVISLEEIEHVADPAEFCKSFTALTVPNGATVISTINRTIRSYATAIIAAEYLLHWVRDMAGFVYNPLSGRWSLSDDIGVNFIAFGTKKMPLNTVL